MTDQRTSFVYVTFIAATPELVFNALISAEITARYWGHANVSNWNVGDMWQHVRNETGAVELVGQVIENTPPQRLVLSWVNKSQQANAAAYSRVTFDVLAYDGGMTKLIVSHDDLIIGSGMEQGVMRGWPIVLSSLKSYLETGTGLNVFAKQQAA